MAKRKRFAAKEAKELRARTLWSDEEEAAFLKLLDAARDGESVVVGYQEVAFEDRGDYGNLWWVGIAHKGEHAADIICDGVVAMDVFNDAAEKLKGK
jgi:hypothetical protein